MIDISEKQKKPHFCISRKIKLERKCQSNLKEAWLFTWKKDWCLQEVIFADGVQRKILLCIWISGRCPGCHQFYAVDGCLYWRRYWLSAVNTNSCIATLLGNQYDWASPTTLAWIDTVTSTSSCVFLTSSSIHYFTIDSALSDNLTGRWSPVLMVCFTKSVRSMSVGPWLKTSLHSQMAACGWFFSFPNSEVGSQPFHRGLQVVRQMSGFHSLIHKSCVWQNIIWPRYSVWIWDQCQILVSIHSGSTRSNINQPSSVVWLVWLVNVSNPFIYRSMFIG